MKRHLLAAGLGLAAAMGLAAAAQAKTLIYCSEGSPENFYPAINTTGTSFDASRQVYNRFAEFKPGTTQVQPGLAQSWEVSKDGLVYTFHLRKGVKWQTTKTFKPSRDFNADDVIFSFERQWKPDNPYFKVTSDNHSYFNDMNMPKIMKSLEKVDDDTVRFTLNVPNAPFIANLAMDFATIMSKEYADQMLKAGKPETFDQEPVGTGPFVFESYQKDAIIRYKANPTYWAGKPKIDSLVFAITPDNSVRYAKLKSGECSLMPYPNPADIAAMKKDPALKVLEQPGLNIGYLAFNTRRSPSTTSACARRSTTPSTRRRSSTRSIWASLSPPRIRSRPPCGPITTRSRTTPTTRPRRRSCSPRPACPTASRPTSGPSRCSGPTTPTAGASPS